MKPIFFSPALIFLFLVINISLFSQSVSLPELIRVPYTSHEEKEQKEYFLYLPYGFRDNPERKWPVLMFLHGHGERGNGRDELDWVMVHGPLYEAWVQKQDLPFLIISPQLPMYGMDTIDTWIRNRKSEFIPKRLEKGTPKREPDFATSPPMKGAIADAQFPHILPMNGWERCDKDLIGMVNTVIQKYHGDTSRIYLTGLSYGGYGTWYMASTYPTLWAAINPIVGWGHPDLMKPIADYKIPLWVFAGGRDPVVPVKHFYPGLNKLEELGHPEVRFTVHEDMGHDAWKRIYAGEDLYNWFLSCKK